MNLAQASEQLLEFLMESRLDDIPDDVVEDGQVSFTDTVGCMLGGTTSAAVRCLIDRVAAPGGGAAIVGTLKRATALNAVLVGGAQATWLDLDTGHRHPSIDPPVPAIHPPVHLVPALLALGEARATPGAELLRIYLLTYEFTARLGIATMMRPGLHGHGIHNNVGVAAAAALISGAGRDVLDASIRLGASLSLMSDMGAAIDGATVRNIFAGLGTVNGLLGHRLAAAGWTAPRDALGTVLGRVASTAIDPDALVDGLGVRWETTLGYYKVHACCRWNHPALDALEELLSTSAVDPADIDSIDVQTFKFATLIGDEEARSELGAKFSIPYAVAARLVIGTTGFRAFTDFVLWNRDLRSLAHRVVVREEPEYSAALPARRPTSVAIKLRDGRVQEATVQGSRGDPGNRFPAGELERKYLDLAGAALGAAGATRSLEVLRDLGALPDTRTLIQALTPVE